MNKGKERIDILVVERQIASTREKAKSLIMAGLIFADGERIDKAGTKVDTSKNIELRGQKDKYVSRGGHKLEKAIDYFGIDLKDAICIDIGASTGGFTDCMLQNGAKKVYAIDVGRGQLDWGLRNDERVVSMEKTNIRYVTLDMLGEQADFISVDVAFISLKLVLPVLKDLLKDASKSVVLIKPQFEAGKGKVGKNGVVKDLNIHYEVSKKILDFIRDLEMNFLGFTYSPIKGPKGNIEYLLFFEKVQWNESTDIDEIYALMQHSIYEAHEIL